MKKLTLILSLMLGAYTAQAQLSGRPDSSFNSNGFHFWNQGKQGSVLDAAADGTGFIYTVGYTYNPSLDFTVGRLQPNGTVDPTFGTNGVATFDLANGQDDGGAQIVMLANGTAIVGGSKDDGGQDFVLMHILKDGSKDLTFGKEGELTIDVGSQDFMYDMILDQGNIVFVGASGGANSDFVVCRIKPEGIMDSSFSQDGILTADIGAQENHGQGIALRPGGGYYVTGYSNNGKSHVIALSESGNYQLAFNGKSSFDFQMGANETRINSICLDTLNNIVLGGYYSVAGKKDMIVARFTPSGSADKSFAGTGELTLFPYPSNTADERLTGMLIQGDGKLLVYGNSGEDEYVIYLIKGDGVKDPFFGTNNGFYISKPAANINFFTPRTLVPTGKEGQYLAVGNIYLGQNDFSYFHAFISENEKPKILEPNSVKQLRANRLMAYPNPTSGTISLDLESNDPASISVMDMQGRTLMLVENTTTLNLDSLSEGMYIIRAVQDGMLYTTRVQKTNN